MSTTITLTDTLTFRALLAVRGDCDGARSDDGKGFSGYDAGFARDLIEKGQRFGWSDRQFAAAQKLAVKYRKQAAAKLDDFTVDAVRAEAAPAKPEREDPAPVVVEVAIQKESAKALFVDVLPQRARYGKRVWVPRSLISFVEGWPEDDAVARATVPAWFASREGLEAVA